MSLIRDSVTIVRETLHNYGKNHGFQNSAMIAYFASLSIIPFFLLMMALFGYVFHLIGPRFGSEEALIEVIQRALNELFPFLTEAIISRLKSIVNARETIGIIGFLFMFFAASLVFEALEISLREVFGKPRKRHFLVTRIFFFLFFTTVGFLFFVMYFLMIISKSWMSALGEGSLMTILSEYRVLDHILTFTIINVGFMIMVYYTARKKIKLWALFGGSLIFFVLFELSRFVFSYYIEHFARFDLVYGSLATIMIGIVWVYYSATIFIVSAEFVRTFHYRLIGRKVEQYFSMDTGEFEVLEEDEGAVIEYEEKEEDEHSGNRPPVEELEDTDEDMDEGRKQ